MNGKTKGFTLVELAIVLIIIGVIITAVLKGQDLLENAKTKRVLNDVKGLLAMQYTFYDRYRRYAGDGDNDGIIDYENLGASLNNFDNIPSNALLTGFLADIDAPFSELEFIGSMPVGNHREVAKHAFNDIFYFSQIDGYNVIVIRNVPCFAAKVIDRELDGFPDARLGYVRESVGATNSINAVGDQTWEQLCTGVNRNDYTLVSLVYFFDKRPN